MDKGYTLPNFVRIKDYLWISPDILKIIMKKNTIYNWAKSIWSPEVLIKSKTSKNVINKDKFLDNLVYGMTNQPKK